jgi:hypothetical protein
MSTATAGPSTALKQSSRQTLSRLAGMSTVIIASVAMLVVGILIGNAARKRIDRWSHGIS